MNKYKLKIIIIYGIICVILSMLMGIIFGVSLGAIILRAIFYFLLSTLLIGALISLVPIIFKGISWSSSTQSSPIHTHSNEAQPNLAKYDTSNNLEPNDSTDIANRSKSKINVIVGDAPPQYMNANIQSENKVQEQEQYKSDIGNKFKVNDLSPSPDLYEEDTKDLLRDDFQALSETVSQSNNDEEKTSIAGEPMGKTSLDFSNIDDNRDIGYSGYNFVNFEQQNNDNEISTDISSSGNDNPSLKLDNSDVSNNIKNSAVKENDKSIGKEIVKLNAGVDSTSNNFKKNVVFGNTITTNDDSIFDEDDQFVKELMKTKKEYEKNPQNIVGAVATWLKNSDNSK